MRLPANDPRPNFWALPQQQSLPEAIADRMVDAIGSGELKPGERIVELKLAGELGVSRGPLREALKTLEARHLVERRPGRGTFVTRVADDDLMGMVMLRANLEGFAARFVASALSPALETRLGDLLAAGRAAARDGRTSDCRDIDWQFHEAVVVGAGNPFLLSAWRAIGNMVRLFLHTHPVFVHRVDAALANHDTLFAALQSGDPAGAEAAFRRVILASAFRRFDQVLPDALREFDAGTPRAVVRGRRDRAGGPGRAA